VSTSSQPFPPSLTAKAHPVALPKKHNAAIDAYVRTQSGANDEASKDKPFERKIDIWFAAIGFAVHKGLDPSKKGGEKFINLGPTNKDIKVWESWRTEFLVALACRHFGSDEPEKYSNPVEIVKVANRYAAAGIGPLLDFLDEANVYYGPVNHNVIEAFAEMLSEAEN